MSFKVTMSLVIQSDMYNNMGEFDKSIEILDKAVIIAEDFQDELMDGRIMASYAIVYQVQEKYEESKEALLNAIEHFQNMNRNNLVVKTMIDLIKVYLKLSDILLPLWV